MDFLLVVVGCCRLLLFCCVFLFLLFSVFCFLFFVFLFPRFPRFLCFRAFPAIPAFPAFPRHADTRTPRHPDTWTPGQSDTRTPGQPHTRTPAHPPHPPHPHTSTPAPLTAGCWAGIGEDCRPRTTWRPLTLAGSPVLPPGVSLVVFATPTGRYHGRTSIRPSPPACATQSGMDVRTHARTHAQFISAFQFTHVWWHTPVIHTHIWS